MKKKVLFLGASGLIGPFVTPGLEDDYDLVLTDVQAHPDGKSVDYVNVTKYEEVLEAARGVDAIMNFTVLRHDPVLSFHVNILGAWHVMKAAAELGIKKVVHSGPHTLKDAYQHDFDVIDPPYTMGTTYYGVTKFLGLDICEIYARRFGIQTVCFLFMGLGESPKGHKSGQDFPSFMVVWEDLQEACRQALEIESVPENFQVFSLHSFPGHSKYRLDKPARMLGYKPQSDWAEFFRRNT
jgi:nucleoside-diphosphate-sugar epimerase